VKLVFTCEACQRFSHKMKAPPQMVQLIAPSWLLQRWGIDIVGKLTPVQGNYTFVVITSGVFHKMDRGNSTHKHELRNNQKVLLAEHSLSIRDTQTQNSGQHKILRQHNIQRISSADWHEGCPHISVSPTVEWSSRESKLFDLSGNEKNIGGREER
jgi:hypothetical protein